MTKEEIYAALIKETERTTRRYTRYEMVAYCMGYFNKIDETIYECINNLYLDSFIDA